MESERETESKEMDTGANPIANPREPLRVSRGFGVDQKTGLFAPVAKRSKRVVSILTPIALPISFSPFSHSSSPSKVKRAQAVNALIFIFIAARYR